MLALLMSCRSTDNSMETPEELIPVRFSIQFSKELLPFPGTRAMPSCPITEPTRSKSDDQEEPGSDKEIQDFCTTIEYIVYKDNIVTTPVRQIQYTSDDDDFGTIYDELPAGSYQIVLLAHSSLELTQTEGVLTFNEVSDTFCHLEEIDIETGMEINEFITLRRAVGGIEFMSSSAVPDNIKSVTLEIAGYPNSYKPIADEGMQKTTATTLTFPIKAEDAGKEEMSHIIFAFIPPNEGALSITFKAIDNEENLLREFTIEEIKPIKNKIIRYTGNLYYGTLPGETLTLSIYDNGEWDEIIEEPIE